MDDSKECTEPHIPSDSNATQSIRFRWFPVSVAIAAILGWVAVSFSDHTRDMRLFTSVAIGLVSVTAVWLWFAFCVCRNWKWRSFFLLTPILIIFAVSALMTVEPVFDGDMAIIGWRPRSADNEVAALKTDALTAVANNAPEWTTTPNDYPAFLGPNLNAVIDNTVLDTDWRANPPKELWRVDVGAGWSGFAVVGEFAVTQEQRGDFEMVVCRRMTNGEIVWTHRDAVRFDPADFKSSLGEIGPRATPTIHNGMVFSHGATGILNCLDARTGELRWSHDTIAENGSRIVTWGKSGSPIIVDANVVVSVGGPNGKSLIAYDIESGDVAWSSGNRQSSYATPVLTTLAGVRQIVCVNAEFVTAHRVKNGEVLWEHPWPGDSDSNASCPNPIPVDDTRVLLCKGYGISSELVEVSQSSDGKFTTKRQWQKPVMRTKMTHAIISGDHVFGLDGGILSCVELETGKKKWKKGRYGHGQVLLVGDVLLVTTELKGEVVLVAASPEKHDVLARHKVLTTTGKMWNYPALAGNYLLIRNAEEAACFELPLRAEE